ncbi:TIGR03086 family metal-binding protein [Nocardia brasiliensis]|uniref:TIGR03086 family metal-binding protein n=1 Tax=Nocardia brasiliensis TaxID=37326 RepID=UPI00366C4DF0
MNISELDARALHDLVPIVEALTDADLAAPTPCTGWQVRDLLQHMNSEHEAVSELLLTEPAVLDEDPRKAFGQVISRWITATGSALAEGRAIRVPKFGAEFSAESLLSIHFADMLVHRWDIAKALGVDPDLPKNLVDVALPIALSIPDTGPLRGVNGYAQAVPVPDSAAPTDRLVAALGRSPNWQRP